MSRISFINTLRKLLQKKLIALLQNDIAFNRRAAWSKMASESADMDIDVQPLVPTVPPPPPPRSHDHPRASSVPLHQSDFTVGYVYSTEMTSHFSPHGHPEDPERISRIYSALITGRHTMKMKWLPIRPVRKEEALLVHSEDHWDKVQAIKGKLRVEYGLRV